MCETELHRCSESTAYSRIEDKVRFTEGDGRSTRAKIAVLYNKRAQGKELTSAYLHSLILISSSLNACDCVTTVHAVFEEKPFVVEVLVEEEVLDIVVVFEFFEVADVIVWWLGTDIATSRCCRR